MIALVKLDARMIMVKKEAAKWCIRTKSNLLPLRMIYNTPYITLAHLIFLNSLL